MTSDKVLCLIELIRRLNAKLGGPDGAAPGGGCDGGPEEGPDPGAQAAGELEELSATEASLEKAPPSQDGPQAMSARVDGLEEKMEAVRVGVEKLSAGQDKLIAMMMSRFPAFDNVKALNENLAKVNDKMHDLEAAVNKVASAVDFLHARSAIGSPSAAMAGPSVSLFTY